MTDEWRYFVIDINPEPWAIGPLSVVRSAKNRMVPIVGRNAQLWHFQQAVKEAIGTQEMYEGSLEIKFWFWRRRDEYKTHQARTHRKHEADATNLQKATEDALQGVLYKNDKDNRVVSSVIVEQGADVEPMIAIAIRQISPHHMDSLVPNEVQDMIADLMNERDAQVGDNSWG